MPLNTLNDHEFGGASTDLKLSMVEAYLVAFTNAIRRKFSELLYIDAFAGTGARTINHGASQSDLIDDEIEARAEQRRGSAQIALDVSPAFNRLIFIEKKKRHVRALNSLKSNYPDRAINVIRGEANAEIGRLIAAEDWRDKRAVLFLDPYGMQVRWETLQAISQTKAIDVWYLVSLTGQLRQAPLDRTKLTDDKRAAISRMLGTTDWEDAWYAARNRTLDLFDFDDVPPEVAGPYGANGQRPEGHEQVADYVEERLSTIFPRVLKPRVLHNSNGVPTFLLFFAVSNPDPKAWGLAAKIADHILKAGSSSQVRPR